MYALYPTPTHSGWLAVFKKLLAGTALLGTLAAAIQNYGIVSDLWDKSWIWVQIQFRAKSALDRVYLEHDALGHAQCNSAKYADLFKVSPCGANEIHKLALSNTSKPTPLEAALMHDFNSELMRRNNALIGGYRKFGNAKERDYANLTAKNEIERLRNVNALLDGHISWGQFNVQRMAIYETDIANMNALKMKHRDI